ncbi:hypothetical protein OYC64_018368 [Pagothenia borchgrevinki]|uniref:Uncharacterized protein n=1 Tax=Pagothenia borchgrevinki TaxID=8213 RepID=A0ABD2GNQ1_PAGBO
MLSTLISPIRHWDTEASSAEDADNSSSSLEVKENEDYKSHMDCDLLRKYHPAAFCTTFPKHSTRSLKEEAVAAPPEPLDL